MGRHHTKLPDHLYITLPEPKPSSTLSSASSFFTSKAGFSYNPATFLLKPATTIHVFERHIPGFRTSAAFLTALRANLDPHIDTIDSPANTPNSLRPVATSTSRQPLPPPSPLSRAMSTSNSSIDADLAPPAALNLPRASADSVQEAESQPPSDPDAIPELTTFPATDEFSRIQALRLVADSVAQQRQRASRALIFHPITVGLLAVAFGLLRAYFYKGQNSDYALIGTTFTGILMSVLVGIRAKTGAYIEEAERVGTWKWLAEGRSSDTERDSSKKILGGPNDEILVTKFGDDYIGAIVFRGVQAIEETTGSSSKRSTRKANAPSQPKTEIRAWTVRQRFRGKGVGTALLEDAIKIAHERGWVQGGIEVAADHANSKVVLPKVFSGFVQNNGERARRFVDKKVSEYEAMSGSANGKGKKKR